MGDIYVEVGPMDSSKAPKEYAAKVKKYLDDSVSGAVDKATGFTTKKEGEGYKIRVKVVELKLEDKSASCKLSGELTRYPKPEMVTTSLTSAAKAPGRQAGIAGERLHRRRGGGDDGEGHPCDAETGALTPVLTPWSSPATKKRRAGSRPA